MTSLYDNYVNLLQTTNFVGGAGQDELPEILGDSRTVIGTSGGKYQFYYMSLITVQDLIDLGYYDTAGLTTDREYSDLPTGQDPSLSLNQMNALFDILHADLSNEYSVSFEDVINIEFHVGDASTANIIYGSTTNGHGIGSTDTSYEIDYSDFPLAANISQKHGDIWINQDATDFWDETSIGSLGYWGLMHETGHALGLIDANLVYGPLLDNQKYTIMSYNPMSGMDPTGSDNEVTPFGLQIMDIAALQTIYGRNYDTRDDNTTYSALTAFASSRPNDAFIYTIWDGGGTDTIDASGYTNAAQIDLRQGHFSSIGLDATGANILFDGEDPFATDPDAGNVAIAFHTVIENAIGTDGDDTIIGNKWSNRLEGGDGNDTLYGSGLQYSDGDMGFDTADMSDDKDPNRSWLGQVDVFVGGKGNDTIYANTSLSDFDMFGRNILDYSADPAGVNVDLKNGTATDGWGDTDTLIGDFHGVLLTDFNDTVRLNSFNFGDNPIAEIDGKGGNDTIITDGDTGILESGVLTLQNGTRLINFEVFSAVDALPSDVTGNIYVKTLGNSLGGAIEANYSLIETSLTIDAGVSSSTVTDGADTDTFTAGSSVVLAAITGTNEGDTITINGGIVWAGTGDDDITVNYSTYPVIGGAKVGTLYYQGGDDVVHDAVNLKTLDFSHTIATADISFAETNISYSTNTLFEKDYSFDLVITVAGHGSITLEGLDRRIEYYGDGVTIKTIHANDVPLINGYDNFTYAHTGATYTGGNIDDRLLGDDVIYGVDNDSLSEQIYGGMGNDTIYAGNDGSGSYNEIYGEQGNDAIYGGDWYDILHGGAGDDILDGGGNSNGLIGGTGNDILISSGSGDSMEGGQGDDTFVFNSVAWNFVSDFGFYGDHDVLDLHSLLVGYVDGVSDINDFALVTVDSSGVHISIDANGGGDDFTEVVQLSTIKSAVTLDDLISGGQIVVTDPAPSNSPPIAQDDDFIGEKNQNTVGYLLSDNGHGADSDADSDTLTVTAGTYSTTHGSVVVLSDGSFTYTPTSNYTGHDSFTYTVNDGHGGTDTAIAGIDVYNYVTGATSGNNTINGTSDHDLIHGLGGNDNIYGAAGNDRIYGDDGNDFLYGGLGDDIIDGGNGTDTATYVDFTSFGSVIVVDLSITGAQDTHDGGIDTFINVENVTGSNGNDILAGNDGNNKISGSNGNDFIYASAGNDTLDGGGGYNTVSFERLEASVDVNFMAYSATSSEGTNFMVNFIHMIGSDYDDILLGDYASNNMTGGAGADTFAFAPDTSSLVNWESSVDTVADFNMSEGDILDISGIIVGTHPDQSAIDDFVTFSTSGGDTTISVDRDGTGGTYTAQAIATLSGVTGLDASDMMNNGNLVA